MMKQPMRTCLVTGDKKSKSELIRFVIQDGVLVWDEKGSLPGRGGYVCNDAATIEKLKNTPKLKGKISHFMKVGKFEIE